MNLEQLIRSLLFELRFRLANATSRNLTGFRAQTSASNDSVADYSRNWN